MVEEMVLNVVANAPAVVALLYLVYRQQETMSKLIDICAKHAFGDRGD